MRRNETAAQEYVTNMTNITSSNWIIPQSGGTADLLVFITLETLGICGWIGNLILIWVIVSSGLLDRPSFIFISNLALADILHSTVTSCYFYPPIIFKRNLFSRNGIRIMNALDWTAWGITLTHMIAICLDRLIAIIIYQDYSRLVTVTRTKLISIFCWIIFATVNIIFMVMNLCCVVIPQPEFYTFGFEIPANNISLINPNVYKRMYVPLECLSMLILAIGNPVILFNLYQKYRRKRNLRAASAVLVEIGQSLCRQPLGIDSSLTRDVKIFLQIIIVTVIFFTYMFIYYLFFYVTEFTDKWSTVLNSICYSITHMINPIVYFSLNEQMQRHVLNLICNLSFIKRRRAMRAGRRNALCGVMSIVQALSFATAAYSESSHLAKLSSIEKEEKQEIVDEDGKRKLGENNVSREDTTSVFTPLLRTKLEGHSHSQPTENGGKFKSVTYYFQSHLTEDDVFL